MDPSPYVIDPAVVAVYDPHVSIAMLCVALALIVALGLGLWHIDDSSKNRKPRI